MITATQRRRTFRTMVATSTLSALLLTVTTPFIQFSPSSPFASAAKSTSTAPVTTSSSGNTKPLQFASPLQTFTVFDKDASKSKGGISPRGKYLPRLKAGLMAERRAREIILEEQRRGIAHGLDDEEEDGGDGRGVGVVGGGWAERSAQAEERQRKALERRVEKAYDEAVKGFDERVARRRANISSSTASSSASSAAPGSEYQFVGVVNDGTKKYGGGNSGRSVGFGDVTWYARKKPAGSTWSLRLVHVNRDAVLRDLFVKGKVDVFGSYVNEGVVKRTVVNDDGEQVEEPTLKPVVKGEYHVKERSWRNLWNFSPLRTFQTSSASSGSFWRERRITPGLYTDGVTVYESVYRYRDGKNGMKPVMAVDRFLEGGKEDEEKRRLVERLKGGDVPDIVVEK